MNDLTVVYYTANRVSDKWEQAVTGQLKRSIGNLPLISVSQKPMDFGDNICVGDIGQTHLNIYRQMLTGTKAAKTRFVAFVEDDIFYPPGHFKHRPTGDDVIAYDMHKWAFFTWMRPPVFHSASHRRTTGCIAPCDYWIEAMEERFSKYPDDDKAPLKFWGEVGRYEKELGVFARQTEEFKADYPHVVVFHQAALGYQNLGRRKRAGNIKVEDLPYWGTAGDFMWMLND